MKRISSLQRNLDTPSSSRVRAFVLSIPVALIISLVAMTGCSDDGGGGSDSGVGDAPSTESGVKLWRCNTPGHACNPHDTCAIDPICGDDGWCHPQGRQDCDDGLDCTDDTCGGNGLCINKPKIGYCALLVKQTTGHSQERCFKVGEVNPSDPCRVCEPRKDARKWSGREGGSCDDNNPCTVHDTCKGGFCEGDYYGNRCNDLLSCTKDVCDGQGGCKNALKSNTCLIKGTCYKQGEASGDGCAQCDPSKDQHAWTPLASLCRIGNRCYAAGSFDSTGCGICNPSQNDKAWSLAPKTCFIDGVCLKAGDKDATGCATCDPQKSTSAFTLMADKCIIGGVCVAKDTVSSDGCGRCDPTSKVDAWTPVAGATVQATTFETDLAGYTVTPAVSDVAWQVSSARAHGGQKSLYYGNPATKNFATGLTANAGTATSPAITLPAGQKATLSFWLYLDAETSDHADVLQVLAGTQVLWTKTRKTLPPTLYRQWVPVTVDLAALAGQTFSLVFSFDTHDAWANTGEGVFIDDVTLLSACGAL